MAGRNPIDADVRRMMLYAANLVKEAANEAPGGWSHRLAFGRGNQPGISEVWLPTRTIAAIQRNESNRRMKRLGFPPVHTSPRR